MAPASAVQSHTALSLNFDQRSSNLFHDKGKTIGDRQNHNHMDMRECRQNNHLYLCLSLAVCAGKGDKETLRSIVDALKHQPSVQAIPGSAFDLKLQTVRDVNGSRQLRCALNLRSNAGQTPLMLAAKHG